MAIKCICRVFLTTVVFTVYTQAMFFTTSKENDYPRIGKRLPASVLNKWLQRDDLNLEKDYTNALREVLKQQTQEGVYGQMNNKAAFSPKPRTPIADEYIYDVIMKYLNYDNDGLPL